MNIFESIKERTNLADVMAGYGILVKNNFALCPFHSERTPSLSVKGSFFSCFGCGSSGDTIKFVQLLFNISALEAAKKINDDFSLGLDVGKPLSKIEKQEYTIKREAAEKYRKWEHDTYVALCDKLHILDRLCGLYEPFSDKWAAALYERDILNYKLDVLQYGSASDKIEMYIKTGTDIKTQNDWGEKTDTDRYRAYKRA